MIWVKAHGSEEKCQLGTFEFSFQQCLLKLDSCDSERVTKPHPLRWWANLTKELLPIHQS